MEMSELKIRQIEAFRAVMLRHTVTRAAESLHISQPAVSRLIADLESRVGFVLFERQQGRLAPTAEARVLFEEVERAFVGLDRITQAAHQIRAMRRGSLRVAGSPAVALDLLPAVIARFVEQHPGIDVSLLAHSATTVVDKVASGQCDVGLTAEAIPHPAVKSERLPNAVMRCIVPRGHRLARRASLSPYDLRGEPFVSFPHSFDARAAIDRVFVEAGVTRNLVIEAQLSQAIVALVANRAGVALIDPVTAAYARQRVAVKRFAPAVHDHFYIVTNASRPVPVVADAFCDAVREAFGRVVAEV
ncbi:MULTISPECIES: LysR substrate-binding domain-containing protein [Caballeronia]|jgi:DNA-binding transcriptional LysR family regulator|uniref:LysR family transcriptional regulator n=1 Tax=Caballeronia zhejiangensis TaxID=871203 RepID=A0A656QR63_9BURK|nr:MULTISPECIES: LysR substrate-binding domain-containing protein [Caballeronia]EKS71449.1 LysR family transcriptional regulator [Burkholderia sp. SJ98]KDR31944.1 LysR family transcriptional regulator [Caballeronia zhejiangensis]MDR5790450.1 LysR substrate-binding domain-containing protein [Caballeronia sp. LP003]